LLYENSEISKNLNTDWTNQTCGTHNPFPHNAAQPGTSIAAFYNNYLYEVAIISPLDFNNYN